MTPVICRRPACSAADSDAPSVASWPITFIFTVTWWPCGMTVIIGTSSSFP